MAYEFVKTSNTVGQYIACGNAASLNPQNNMTLACWVYPTTNIAAGQIAHMYLTRDGSTTNRCYSLMRQAFTGTANTFYAEVFKNNTTATTIISTTVGAINTWYHLCLTYKFVTDGTSEIRLYVNGIEEASKTNSVGPINLATVNNEIGRRAGSINYPADAIIAECAIYNTTLTAGEVNALAKGMSPNNVSPQGLVLYAPLVRNIIDLKGNTLTNNGATVKTHPRVYA